MDKGRWGTALLLPAAAIFSLRAALSTFGIEPHDVPGLGPTTALTGILSLVGLGLWVWQDRKKLAYAVISLTGHMVVMPFVDVGLGAGLVYLGMGLMVVDRRPAAAGFGMAALVGAVVREAAPWGHLLVAVAAGALAWSLWRTLQDMRSQA